MLLFSKNCGELPMMPTIALSLAMVVWQAATAPDPPPTEPPSPTVPAATPATPARRPCRNPDASGAYRTDCGITPPKVLHTAYPEFSEEARGKTLGGVVGVVLTVDENGDPQNVQIYQSLADKVDPKNRKAALSLDQQAIACVKKYKFAPATYQGKPVAIQLHVQVNFHIF
jgi:TonB family protein